MNGGVRLFEYQKLLFKIIKYEYNYENKVKIKIKLVYNGWKKKKRNKIDIKSFKNNLIVIEKNQPVYS